MTFLLDHRRIILGLVLLSAVAALFAGAYWDSAVINIFRQHEALVKAHETWLRFFSDCADTPSLIWLLLILLVFFNERRVFLYGSLALLCEATVAQVLKDTFKRARPNLSGHYVSFPSGHAAAAFTMAIVFWFRYPKQRIYFLLVAALLASTRVILLEHWPSDVLAAAAIGMTIALLVEPLVRRLPAMENYSWPCLAGVIILFLYTTLVCFGIILHDGRKMLVLYAPLIATLCIVKWIQRRRLPRETQSINQQ